MIIVGGGKGKNNDFLFTSYVLDYNDNYHRQMGEPSSELEKEARQIRRRYKSQQEYLNAVAVYEEYMELIVQKNGGKKIFKLKYKAGLIHDFVPHKPRMKNTRLNRALEKNEIVISDPSKTNFKTNFEDMQSIAELQSDDIKSDFIYDDEASDKEAERLIASGKLRLQSFSEGDSLDYLERWFLQNRVKNKDVNKVVKSPSLTELLNRGDNDDYEEESDDDILYFRGQLMGRKAIEQLNTAEKLNSLGWNSLKVMRTMNKKGQVTKILEKRKKADKIKKKKAKQYNAFMSGLVGDNHESFEDFEMDMLSFTADELFK